MVTRTVTVRLRADISNYTRGMRQASDNTSRLANGSTALGAAMLTGFAVAAAAAAKFDKALSNVRAVTGASTADMGKLRAAALEAGKTTSFTATEAANAEAELARAGVSVANITGGALKGSLALAASGQINLSESATIAAQAMNTFGLKGKDVTHIADVLSAGANKSASDVHGLGESLRMGGLLAHQTGLSLEDTVGVLSAFADHALIGSDAGTSLKTMLMRLTPQSKEAQAAMDSIGLSAYDSSGKFVGLSEFAGRLQKSFSGLTPEARNSAMSVIFGADAVRSATILYELGSAGVNKYVKSVNDSGAAQRMASIQTDNLMGDMERLRGALEVALIEGGSAANASLRTMTQFVTSLVNAYSGLSPELQHAVTGFMGVGGAVAFVGGAMLLLLPRVAATRAALVSMGVTAGRARLALSALGSVGALVGVLAAVTYGVSALKKQMQDAPPSTSKLANALLDFGKKGKVAGELSKTFGSDLGQLGEAVQQIAHPSVTDRLSHLTEGIKVLSDQDVVGADQPMKLADAKQKLTALDDALTELVQSGAQDQAAAAFAGFAKEAEAGGTSTEKFRTLLPKYGDALASADTQTKLAAGGQKGLGDATAKTADEIKDTRTEAEKLTESLKALNGVAISAAEKEIGFRQSLADLTSAVKDNGHSLDVTTKKGREVKGAFLDAAQAAMDHAEAVSEQTGSQKAGQGVLEKDIELLKKQMHAAGFSKDAINKLTAAYLQLPGSKVTKVDAKVSGALTDLEAVRKKVAATKGKSVTVSALTKEARDQLEALGFKIKGTKGKKVTITVPTGSQKAAVDALKRAIDALRNKSITLTTTQVFRTVQQSGGSNQAAKNAAETNRARGGIVRRAAGGPVFVSPNGGPVSGPGTGTSDSIPALISNGEYVVKADAVRKYGVTMFDRMNAKRFASGGLAGFTYAPTGAPALGGAGDAKSRYDKEVEALKAAWTKLSAAMADAKKKATAVTDAERNLSQVRHRHHTKAQLDAAENKVSKARRDKRAADGVVGAARKGVNAADKALGVKAGSKAPTAFNLAAYLKQLTASAAATDRWQKNLTKIGARGGKEIQDLLEGMGEDGYALVNSLAGASDKQFKDITAKLKKTGGIAKATLADFNKQLGASTAQSATFAADLEKLAASGFGELAQALAAQGDDAAQALAHQAAGSSKDAGAANTAVKKAQAALSGDDLTNALVLLTTLRGGTGRGYADLIAAGLDTATIKALAPKIMDKIAGLPAGNKDTFLRQLAGQGGTTAMARGGILNRPGLVLGGEAGVSESWIPHDGSARSRALLATTARLMGYDARPAHRFGSPGGGGAGQHFDQRTTNLTLNGAKQTSAEQAMDVARHMHLIG